MKRGRKKKMNKNSFIEEVFFKPGGSDVAKKRKICYFLEKNITLSKAEVERGLPRNGRVFFFLQKGLKADYLEIQHTKYLEKGKKRCFSKWASETLDQLYLEIEKNGFGNFEVYRNNGSLGGFSFGEIRKKAQALIGFSKPSMYYKELFFKFSKEDLRNEKKFLLAFGEKNNQKGIKKGKLLRDSHGIVDCFIKKRLEFLKKTIEYDLNDKGAKEILLSLDSGEIEKAFVILSKRMKKNKKSFPTAKNFGENGIFKGEGCLPLLKNFLFLLKKKRDNLISKEELTQFFCASFTLYILSVDPFFQAGALRAVREKAIEWSPSFHGNYLFVIFNDRNSEERLSFDKAIFSFMISLRRVWGKASVILFEKRILSFFFPSKIFHQ